MSTANSGGTSGALAGRVAVVVGGSRGIGRGVAFELAAAGAAVVVAGRTLEATPGRVGCLADVVDEIKAAGFTSVPVRCDAKADDQLVDLFALVQAELGGWTFW